MDLIFQLAVLIMSVVIHEVAHGYAALAQGDRTAEYQGRLTLNPLRHLDPFGSILVPFITYQMGFIIGWAKPVPFNPYNLKYRKWGEALVALAGPASNIAVALAFGLLIRFAGGSLTPAFLALSGSIVFINLILAVFNMVPIPPLDGSKVLFSLFPYHWSKIRFALERYSLFFALLFVLFLWQYLIPVVVFLFSLIVGV